MASFVHIRVGEFTKLDVRSLTRNAQLQFEAAFKDSVKVFVQDLAARVHLQTGESFASLEPLAAAVGVSIFPSGRGTGFRRKPSLEADGTTISGSSPRGQASGVALGADAFILNFSRGSFLFTFDIPTYQFALHNRGSRGSGTMKNALEDAEIAMFTHLELNTFPMFDAMITEWINTGKVRSRSL